VEKMEKIDILVKGVPVQLHNIFKGFTAMKNKTVIEGIIDSMFDYIDKASGGKNEDLQELKAKYYQSGKKK
jgi:hypothetical protein